MKRDELTQDILKEKLTYNPENGVFTYNHTICNKLKGTKAGTLKDGYIYISVNKIIYLAQRLAWLYIYGEFPDTILDHIDRDRANNRITNLRKSNHSLNGRNCYTRSHNKCGIKGVNYIGSLNKWRSRSTIAGVEYHLGVFNTQEEAQEARRVFDERYEKSIQVI